MLTLAGFSVSNYHNKVKLALYEKGVAFARLAKFSPFVAGERKANAELMARERTFAA